MILLFWSSFNNIEKVQKLSDNKTVILHWITKDKENSYEMNLSFEDRNTFLNELMERIKNFGMVFDISKMNKQNEIEKREQFKTDSKFRNFEKEKEKEKEIKEEKLDDEKEENNNKNKLEKKEDENNIDNIDNNINEKVNEILGNKPNNINNDNNESSTKEEEKMDN